MDNHRKEGSLEDPRNRSTGNVEQAREAGAEIGRTGSTGSALGEREWKPDSEERKTTADPETGSTDTSSDPSEITDW
ncbi:MAG TPA: hypothetical protein VHK69_06940 [Chitinophagaceae bacterium]|nr:hypothetical protein [Chitinophagaceae bacterium]